MKNQNQNLEKYEKKELLLNIPEEKTKEEDFYETEQKILPQIESRLKEIKDPDLIAKANNKLDEYESEKQKALSMRLPERNIFDEFNQL